MIATVGDDVDPVLIGVRDYSVRKLVLLHTPLYEPQARGLRERLEPLHIDVELREVQGDDVLMDTLRQVGDIQAQEGVGFTDRSTTQRLPCHATKRRTASRPPAPAGRAVSSGESTVGHERASWSAKSAPSGVSPKRCSGSTPSTAGQARTPNGGSGIGSAQDHDGASAVFPTGPRKRQDLFYTRGNRCRPRLVSHAP